MQLTIKEAEWRNLTVSERRTRLCQLEKACGDRQDEFPVDLPITELFCNGVYARTMSLPKGTCLVGKIHLIDQINVVSKGSLIVATEDGVKRITAPCIFISKAGIKRAGFVEEDTVWTEFIATTLTTTDAIEEEFITNSYERLDQQLETVHDLGSNRSSNDSDNRKPSDSGKAE